MNWFCWPLHFQIRLRSLLPKLKQGRDAERAERLGNRALACDAAMMRAAERRVTCNTNRFQLEIWKDLENEVGKQAAN